MKKKESEKLVKNQIFDTAGDLIYSRKSSYSQSFNATEPVNGGHRGGPVATFANMKNARKTGNEDSIVPASTYTAKSRQSSRNSGFRPI